MASAFEKRLKRRVIGPRHGFFAVCPPGMESICASEMTALGIPAADMAILRGGIAFEARLIQVMELNLKLGSASRILMRISAFSASSFARFEKKISEMDWALYLPQNPSIRFSVTLKKSRLYHSGAVAQRCEHIIRHQLGPGASGTSADSLEHTVYIRAEDDRFVVSLDTTGELLFKRGIKQVVTAAPLRENLAFAMLFWTRFSADDLLVDPMCGSGTFSLEAAMIQSGLPPGFFRRFAFETWPAFSMPAFEHLKKQAAGNMRTCETPSIFASDTDENVLAALKQNIRSTVFEPFISVQQLDFFEMDPKTVCSSRKGVILLNPPYGKRLDTPEHRPEFFTQIRRKLLQDFKGWRVGILVPDHQSITGLNLSFRFRPVFHGGLDIFAGIGRI